MKKIAILSLSLLILMGGATLSPLLSSISNTYPNTNPMYIKSLVTIPSLLVIVISFVMSRFSHRTNNAKKIVLVGIFTYFCGGILPLVFDMSFLWLIICRIILGIGLGIIAPYAISIIIDCYNGVERTKMLGLAGAMNNLGTVTAVLFAGFFGKNNWKYGLLIYILALLSFLLFFIYFPRKSNTEKLSNERTKKKSSIVWSKGIVITYLQIFWGTLTYFIIPTSLSFYLSTVVHNSNTTLTGVLLAATAFVGVISGMCFKYIVNGLGAYTQYVVFLLFFVSMMLLATCSNIYIFLISLGLSGLSLGLALPLFNQNVVSYTSTKSMEIKAVTIGTSLIFLGQFISPFFVGAIIDLLSLDKAQGPFMVGASVSLVMLFVSLTIEKTK